MNKGILIKMASADIDIDEHKLILATLALWHQYVLGELVKFNLDDNI